MPAGRLAAAHLLGALAALAVGVPAAAAQEDSVAVAITDSAGIAGDSALSVADTLRHEHPQDVSDRIGFLFETPDQRGQLRIRASIRLNGAYDFNGLRSTDSFDTYQIPVGADLTEEARFFLQATQSRIGFELSRATPGGLVFGRIEADFRGSGDSFRLRHAFGQYRQVLAGQTWSTFTDLDALPLTVDFEGPPSSTNVRSPQIRYSASLADSLSWAVALEAPKADVSSPDSSEATFQGFGDITARAKLTSDWGHVQISAVFRSLAANDSAGNTEFLPGLGGMLSGRSQVSDVDAILFQFLGGLAISRFVGSLGGKGLDLIYDPNTGEYERMISYGGFITWNRQRLLGRELETNVTGGILGVQNRGFQSDDSYKSSQYLSANAFWRFTEGGRVGLEGSWGRRVNKDGASGTATRLSFALYFDF